MNVHNRHRFEIDDPHSRCKILIRKFEVENKKNKWSFPLDL